MKKSKKYTHQKGRKVVNILGINVDSSSTSSLLTSVGEKISHNVKFYIVTPNPELILSATKNPALKRAMNSADFAIPDGVGLKLADSSLKIIKGRELFLDLIKLAKKKRWRVFLLGGLGDEAELAARKLKAKYIKGPKLDTDAEPASEVDRKIEIDSIDQINKFRPQLLFVAFGNPKQEIWLYKNLAKLRVGGAMAVGGTFRYIAGMSKLPPKWMEKIGLEWLWRLLTEPFRVKRVWNAVVVFPLKVWLSRL